MRVTLDPSDPTKVTSFTPFMSGGVPGDTGAATGPDPPVQPSVAYNGEGVGGCRAESCLRREL